MGWCSKLDVFEKPDNEVGGRGMKRISRSRSHELVWEVSRSRFVRSRLVGSRLHGSDLVRLLISETTQGAGRVSPATVDPPPTSVFIVATWNTRLAELRHAESPLAEQTQQAEPQLHSILQNVEGGVGEHGCAKKEKSRQGHDTFVAVGYLTPRGSVDLYWTLSCSSSSFALVIETGG